MGHFEDDAKELANKENPRSWKRKGTQFQFIPLRVLERYWIAAKQPNVNKATEATETVDYITLTSNYEVQPDCSQVRTQLTTNICYEYKSSRKSSPGSLARIGLSLGQYLSQGSLA